MNHAHRRYIVFTTAVGALVLVWLSLLQKGLIGAPIRNPVGYIIPAVFGGGTGFVYGYFNVGRKRRIKALERESEIRRLISAVNHSLVKTDSIEEMAPSIADSIGSSSLFECTYVYLFEPSEFEVVCTRNTDQSESAVTAFHTEAYVDSVFESRALRVEDVTNPPIQHHESGHSSHTGVGIALGHEDDRYGVLTVHFHPGVEPTDAEIDLLETIGADFGYFVHNQLVEAERQSFVEIVERIDDPVMIQDVDGTFRVGNEAVADFAGMDQADLLGTDEFAFMDDHTAQTVVEMKDRVLEAESPVSYQVTPTFPDGRERTFSTTRYPYYDEQGCLDGTIAVCRDITDLEAHQQQLRVLDRVLRHNVNNNMNVVQGYAEMIAEEASGELAQHAEKIAANSSRLLDIAHKQRKITDFLSQQQAKETIDVSTVVEQVTDRIRTENPRADVSVTVPESAHAWAARSVGDAVAELLTNSIVHAESVEPSPAVDVESGSETVRIRVADENQPIPEMDRDVLAGENELGALRHGSGLGLWLVKLIVDTAGGTVSYEDKEPRGNVVTIELPAGPQHESDRG